MASKESRTKVKAIYILHRLWQSINIDQSNELTQLLLELKNSHFCEKTKSGYFSLRIVAPMHRFSISNAKKLERKYDLFSDSYARYVLSRCELFSPSFEEFVLNFDINESNLILEKKLGKLRLILKKAQSLLSLLLKCNLARDAYSDVTIPCLDLLMKGVQKIETICNFNIY